MSAGRGWSALARRSGSATGQAIVEFALVFPIFLIVLFAMIDAGRYVYMSSVLSQAAREGARLAAVEASWIGSTDGGCNTSGGPACPANGVALKADAVAAANRMVVPFGSITTLYISCNSAGGAPTGAWTSGTACTTNTGSTGNVVSVRVILTYRPITPVGSLLAYVTGSASAPFSAPITTSGSATMVIN